MDAKILFFSCFFEISGYKSIECKSAQEIKAKLTENENIKFLVIPEEKSNFIKFPEGKEKPIVLCITKDYAEYRSRNFNKILVTEKTAEMIIERWR